MIIIDKWTGRLGNNLLQLEYAIMLCMFLKCKITFHCNNHPYLDVNIIKDYFSEHPDIGREIITYYGGIPKGVIPSDRLEELKHNTYALLKKGFKIKDIKQIYDETVLVIHIRSGDIMSSNPHPGYVPLPLYYYKHIIDSASYKKIILVCEDKKNPVVDKLLTLYPNCQHTIQSLDEDIKIILGATNIVCGVGTFVTQLTKLANHKQLIIKPSLEKEMSEYYIKNRPWKHTEEQRKLIVDYTFHV